MIKKHLNTIWKDPVWSKVISVGIVGLISFAYIKVESIRANKPIKEIFEELLKKELPLKYILIIALIGLVAYFLFSKFNKKEKIKYNEEHKALDKALMQKIRNEILLTNNINFVREYNFRGNAFRHESLDAFFKYEHYCDNPDFEFIDVELNKILSNLTIQVKRFMTVITTNTWRVDNPNIDAYTVPPEWEDEQPERFNQVVREIHESASGIWKNYNSLVKLAKRKLGI